MRLGQLARKLDVKPSEVRSFLKDELNIELDENPNVKLEDDQIDAVRSKFEVIEEVLIENMADEETKDDPVIELSDTDEADIESDNTAEVTSEEVTTEAMEEPVEAVADENSDESTNEDTAGDADSDDEAPLTNEDGTVIAPKTTLPGVTVIGKIELPQEVERELPMIEVDGVMRAVRPGREKGERKKKRRTERRTPNSRSSSDSRRDKDRSKFGDHSEQFKSEEELEKDRKAETAKREKKEKEEAGRRKDHYKTKHAKQAPAKSKKAKNVEAEKEKQVAKAKEPKAPEPKSGLGKLWKWFNT